MNGGEAISIEELELAFSLILEGLRQRSSPIGIADNFYWLILEEQERYDIHTEPKALGVGQLPEDLSFLRSALADGTPLDTYLLSKLLPILQNIVDRDFGLSAKELK